jgi:Ca-activated chloride channel family protein
VTDYRYHRFDRGAASLRDQVGKLRRLFNELLLRVGGDAEEAMRYLKSIGERHGLFDESFGMSDFRKLLEKDRTVAKDSRGRLKLTPKGERVIRAESLDAIFSSLRSDAQGEHRVPAAGEGRERLPETRPYAFGDPVSLVDGPGTISNAIRRGGIDQLSVTEEDLEVFETEQLSSCATVMLVDVSHSMILYGEDRITPAKRVAMALAELITTRYPKDSLHVVLFGDEAREVSIDDLPYISVGPFHTNTRGGLRLAQEILRTRRQVNRQIFMITDGKPSALTERNGQIYKNPFGLDERIVNKTLDEAAACRRLGIPVTTFMLTDEPVLVDFVDTFTKVNHGRAYYSEPNRLGDFVLVDFLRNRRRRVR